METVLEIEPYLMELKKLGDLFAQKHDLKIHTTPKVSQNFYKYILGYSTFNMCSVT